MAKRLDGSADTYTHADSTALRPAFPITLGMWYRSATGPGNFKYMVSKVATAGDHPSYGINTNGSGEIRFVVGIGLSNGAFTATSGIGTSFTYDGLWHHYAGIYDGANVQIWFDGQLIDAQAQSTAIAYDVLPLWIGSFDGSILFASGDYAEIALWSTALTANDLLAIGAGVSSKQVRPDKMVEFWSMLGTTTEAGEFGAQTLTIGGGAPAVIDHPKVYGRSGRSVQKLTTTAAAPSNKGMQFMPFFG